MIVNDYHEIPSGDSGVKRERIMLTAIKMGAAVSCYHDCGRQARWAIIFEHGKLTKLRDELKDCELETFIDRLHQNCEQAEKLGGQITHLVGRVKVPISVNIPMLSFLCDRCFDSINLNLLPPEWGWNSHYKWSGYHNK